MPKLARLPANEGAPGAIPAEVHRIARPKVRYYAFLSYSHKDEELADWLHRELEQFRVPHTLAGKLTTNGVVPKRLTPIFRDRHELAAADDLGAEIRHALAASQYLIVLCSPDAAKSRWTNAEIEEFKRNRPDGCVLAAIVGGEPFASELVGRESEECFPPALRQKFDRRGRATGKRAEPLAADLREGADGRRLGFLKLVAGMLGVGLDDLVQREATRRHRRLAVLAAGSLIGMVITSTLSVTAFQSRNEARDQRRQAEGLIGFMLGDLKDKLEPIGRLDALDAVGSRALTYYQAQDKSELSDEALAQRSRALTLMGEIAQTRGDLAGALNRYTEALASTGEAVRRYPEDPKRLFDHAQNVFWVGYIDYQRGNVDRAAAHFREYKSLAEQMVALAPERNEYRLEEVYANTNLGTVLIAQHRYREAVATYTASLSVAESLSAADPRNVDYRRQVSDNVAWLAEAHEFAGALEQAIGERERQLRLLNELRRSDPRDTVVQRDAMTSHRALGRLLASRGDVAGGLRELLTAAAISDDLFRIEPENTDWLQWNAMGRFDLADLQLSTGHLDDAASTLRAGCDTASRLVQRDASVADWKATAMCTCLNLRAKLELARGNPDQAFGLSKQAIIVARSNPKPTDRALMTFLATSTGGDALAAAGKRDEAVRWWTGALAAMPRSIELRPRDMAALQSVQAHLGNGAAARNLAQRLNSLGYRYPAFGRAKSREGVS
jgi:tetratricopeptide (TPR) repeat protein